MNIDLREVKAFPADVSLEAETDNSDLGIERVSFRDVMAVKVNIQKVGDEYYCSGYVTVPVEDECSRCLSLFETELSGDLNFIVRQVEHKLSTKVIEEDDVIYVKPNEPIVELSDIIRQSLTLSLPLKPLCSQDCKGLCPNCGVNLNEETCDCKAEEIDERWDGLRDLLE